MPVAALPDPVPSATDRPAGRELLRLTGITKDFPGVRALDQVDFTLERGEVHVLFGENGAGKSTLINVVAGALQPDQGTIVLNGAPTRLRSVQAARRAGVAAVFQEFSLAADLTVEENLFLGAEPTWRGFINKRAIRQRAHAVLARLGFAIDPAVRVSGLARAEQQMVEIAKAVLADPQVLILDEPTASLTEREQAQLFALIRRLTATQLGVIYITHRIAEISEIGDRVSVLRDGRHVATLAVPEVTPRRLVELMTGRTVGDFYPTIAHRPGETLLRLRQLATADRRVRDASIEVRAGEIVGLAGLVGSGKSEIGQACYGLQRIAGGSIELFGQTVERPTPRRMLQRGLCYVPPDRRRQGLLLQRATRENIALSALGLPDFSRLGILRRGQEQRRTAELANRLQVKPLRLEALVATYSGGNQQKIMLAKGMTRTIRCFVLDEPTIGIDVGAKMEVYRFLGQLVDEGVGVLLISSELSEVLQLCNRVYVVSGGVVTAELQGDAKTEARALAEFFGRDQPDASPA